MTDEKLLQSLGRLARETDPWNHPRLEDFAAGNLSVNSHASVRYWTPFGGFGESGLGRELGPDAIAHFTETKNVCIAFGGSK